jgi:hypothetical protein
MPRVATAASKSCQKNSGAGRYCSGCATGGAAVACVSRLLMLSLGSHNIAAAHQLRMYCLSGYAPLSVLDAGSSAKAHSAIITCRLLGPCRVLLTPRHGCLTRRLAISMVAMVTSGHLECVHSSLSRILRAPRSQCQVSKGCDLINL